MNSAIAVTRTMPSSSLEKKTIAATRPRTDEVIVRRASRAKRLYATTFGAVASGFVSAVILLWWCTMVLKARLAWLGRRTAARWQSRATTVTTPAKRTSQSSSKLER
jgi:hypothetical protein